jgi:hypothetical protein
MTDTIFEPAPSSVPAHRIFSQGMIYDVNYFFENEQGDGGCFTVIGMNHDTPKPPDWTLETIATGFKQRISIYNLEDASDISGSDTSVTPKTSCDFAFL